MCIRDRCRRSLQDLVEPQDSPVALVVGLVLGFVSLMSQEGSTENDSCKAHQENEAWRSDPRTIDHEVSSQEFWHVGRQNHFACANTVSDSSSSPRRGLVAMQKDVPIANVSDIKDGFQNSIFWKTSKPVLIRGAAEDLFHETDSSWSIAGLLKSKHADQLLPVSYGGRISQSNTRGRMQLKELIARENMTVSFFNWPFSELGPEAPSSSWKQGGIELGLQKEYFAKLKPKNFVRPE
eukprot:1450215-Amphidinium_carterae.1